MLWPGVKVTTRRLRDLFRLRYWVVCWHCDLERGPYLTEAEQIRNLDHDCPAVVYSRRGVAQR